MEDGFGEDAAEAADDFTTPQPMVRNFHQFCTYNHCQTSDANAMQGGKLQHLPHCIHAGMVYFSVNLIQSQSGHMEICLP